MLVRPLLIRDSPAGLYRRLARHFANTFLFESLEGPERLARYSFLGFNPLGLVEVKDGAVRVSGKLPSGRSFDRPTEYLRTMLAEVRAGAGNGKADALGAGLRYDGGLVGFLGYDYVRYLERLPGGPADDEVYPDAQFGVYLDGVVFDHVERRVSYFSHADDRSESVLSAAQAEARPRELAVGELTPNIPEEEFVAKVERLKRYIQEGHVFQCVLSKRLRAPYRGDVLGFYDALRASNPSPYMYSINFGERNVIGASPEMLVRVTGREVDTFPIAGTSPLGKTPQETDALAEELKKDTKERAEHVMLVDLARNDLGRVCEYGTVTVPEFMKVERYSHVQHLVSRVNGRLAPERDALDAFDAVFPAGTVTGAPKVRAMEILDELEPTRRGPYAGAVGYFALNGNLDTAITIRTLTATHSHVSIQSGAGIVADSVPRREWQETEHKARALVAALQSAGQRLEAKR